MPQIITQGTRPAPQPVPWHMEPLTCPDCGTVFRLSEGDLTEAGGQWDVRTERSPNGKSEAIGPCPYCLRTVTIARKR